MRKEDRVLDLGCIQHSALKEADKYWLHKLLYKRASYVLGVDKARNDVEILQKKGYNIIYGDVENIDLGEKFDIVIAGDLIEHLSNPGLFLDVVRKHLNSNGRFILTTPNAFFIYHSFSAFFGNVKCNIEHTCFFDKRTIGQLLNRYGFKIQKFMYIPPPVSTFFPRPIFGKNSRKAWVYRVGLLLSKCGRETLGCQNIFLVATLKS